MTPLFPRGNGPLVSILIPTRNRPAQLMATVGSFHRHAKDKTCYEFVFKIDDDDPQTAELICSWKGDFDFKVIASPRGNGYADLHKWTNWMADVATGDWLWLFDDDAVILTPNWDEAILHLTPTPPYIGAEKVMAWFPSNQEIGFPCVRRGLVELLGHFSLDPVCDRWIHCVVNLTTNLMLAPLTVCHGHGDRAKLEEQPDKERVYNHAGNHFYDRRAQRQLLEDCRKVLDYLDDADRRAVWVDNGSRMERGWHMCKGDDRVLFLAFVEDDGKVRSNVDWGEKADVRWCKL